MASGTKFADEYKQAERAYMLGSYEEAASIIDRLAESHSADPNVCLLRGHIYCYGLQQFDLAREQYQSVLNLTTDEEYVNYANKGLADAEEFNAAVEGAGDAMPDSQSSPEQTQVTGSSEFDAFDSPLADQSASQFGDQFADQFADIDRDFASTVDSQISPFANSDPNWQSSASGGLGLEGLGSSDLDPDDLGDDQLDFADLNLDSSEDLRELSGGGNPFATPTRSSGMDSSSLESYANPFAASEASSLEDFDDVFPPAADGSAAGSDPYGASSLSDPDDSFSLDEFEPQSPNEPASSTASFRRQFGQQASDDETLFMGMDDDPEAPPYSAEQYSVEQFDEAGSSTAYGANFYDDDDHTFVANSSGYSFDQPDDREFSTSEEPSLEDTPPSGGRSSVDFLDEFDEFDDLGSLPDFDLSDNSVDFTSPSLGSTSSAISTTSNTTSSFDFSEVDSSLLREDDAFPLANSAEPMPTFTQGDSRSLDPEVSVEQGWTAPLENAPLATKKWIIGGVTGTISMLAVAAISMVTARDVAPVNRLAMSATAGVTSFGSALVLSGVATRQAKRTAADLQAQFDAVSQGNLSVRANVYSEDEFGRLATGFNQMTRVILTTTSEAQRKAEEQEQAKEDLQRQVIRLLDDVEGAARGDLTVQAEVTADVLGAVADSFNLTIQNLREIVQQVKLAARQVTKSSTENEIFARSLSSDALRQAEELAVTLNSVQVMTDSIQRVAESAREAEEVARSASATALKGGEAVERTVSGILEIRETVAETTRKVKRLAESSQEISKIVALISQIASRTNLLALNASIEAARAGEAGRGFAIVADEVRQLADRAAKSSKEIEQIVLQIQGETSSVMTAMEEGTQQVIEGTRLAEQAKRSLEDIIQVSNRIDVLVRSITADTVEQTETSRNVAQVMQSVELTAQETSQEAQRVSGSLQNQVGVARDLLSSVERFRVEKV
ncbi:MAG: HAMP domain-containing protein [Pegethrix bostrychoides GSE-TBD4-15B]|jgi:twitching motility protein PilJ|uniref:HAMP domain-containing protein n=1 Tax=Pegethrix bostrychoides GSE-TBD4-15B TaxID=2839662 RepID=A0A951PCR2_9CYAN|nr:HAMP domain-containing protein [Pegethrix bostrychoides GSE-TBD4-15B]